jgi:hypothetical protein
MTVKAHKMSKQSGKPKLKDEINVRNQVLLISKYFTTSLDSQVIVWLGICLGLEEIKLRLV